MMLRRKLLGALSGFLIGLLLATPAGRAGLHDMVWMTVIGNPGTGTFQLGSAIPGYLSVAAVSASGELESYHAQDVAGNWENGRGVWTPGSAGGSLTRGVITSSNSNALVSFGSGSTTVYLTALAADAVSTFYQTNVLTQVTQPVCPLTAAPTIISDALRCANDPTRGVGTNSVALTSGACGTTCILGVPGHLPAGGGQTLDYLITHFAANDLTLALGFVTSNGAQFDFSGALNGQRDLLTCKVLAATDPIGQGPWCALVPNGIPIATKAWIGGATTQGVPTGTTLTLAVSAPAHSSVICGAVSDNTGVSSVADNLSGGFTAGNTGAVTSGSHPTSIWYELNIPNAITSIVFTWGTTDTDRTAICDWFAGVTSVAAAPQWNAQLNLTAGTNVIASGSGAASANDQVWAVTFSNGSVAPTAGTGYTLSETNTVSYFGGTERKSSVGATETATFSYAGGTISWTTEMVILH